jgi:hypothetical protein
MCFGNNPSVPAATPAPATPQDPNIADLSDARKKRQLAANGMAGGTLLTGPTGIENSQLNTGKNSLLGS